MTDVLNCMLNKKKQWVCPYLQCTLELEDTYKECDVFKLIEIREYVVMHESDIDGG